MNERHGGKTHTLFGMRKGVWIPLLALLALLALFYFPIETNMYYTTGEVLPSTNYLNMETIEREAMDADPFYFTTVRMYLAESVGTNLMFRFMLNDARVESMDVYSEQSGLEMTSQDVSAIGRFYTQRSMENIALVALEYMGEEVGYEWVPSVIHTLAHYSTGHVFEVGDEIVQVDGRAIDSIDDFMAYRNESLIEEGTEMDIRIRREGELHDVTVTFSEQDVNGDYVLGIYLADRRVFDGAFNPEELILLGPEFQGDSAGLMITLELIQQLTEEDLTRSRGIAGTGGIDAQTHRVYEVGDVDMKVRTAEENGMDIFFVPAFNEEAAPSGYTYEMSNESTALQAKEAHNLAIDVVPVATVEEAIDYLRQ